MTVSAAISYGQCARDNTGDDDQRRSLRALEDFVVVLFPSQYYKIEKSANPHIKEIR